MITAASDQRAYDAQCDATIDPPCPVGCRCPECDVDGPHEPIDLVAKAKAASSLRVLTPALGRVGREVDAEVVDTYTPWILTSGSSCIAHSMYPFVHTSHGPDARFLARKFASREAALAFRAEHDISSAFYPEAY